MSDLARFLFDRQADSYDSDPTMRELAWADPDIRKFWDDEAQAIHKYLAANQPCDICGEESVMSDGIVGAYICAEESCFHAAWDKAYQ